MDCKILFTKVRKSTSFKHSEANTFFDPHQKSCTNWPGSAPVQPDFLRFLTELSVILASLMSTDEKENFQVCIK
jgi:hypothetical protein